MLNVIRPFKRRGWSVARLIVAAAYITRFGEYTTVSVLRRSGVQRPPDPLHLPPYYLYPLLTASLLIADVVLRQGASLLNRPDLPNWLAPLEMVWSEPVRIQVWRPAFHDERALYHLQPQGASRWLKNAAFLVKLTWMIALTTRVALLDRPFSRLMNMLRS